MGAGAARVPTVKGAVRASIVKTILNVSSVKIWFFVVAVYLLLQGHVTGQEFVYVVGILIVGRAAEYRLSPGGYGLPAAAAPAGEDSD